MAIRSTFSVFIAATLLILVSVAGADAQRECWDGIVPAGALPGQPSPVFCSITEQGPDTARLRENRFRDTFQHGLSFADFDDTSYAVFDSVGGSVFDSIHWRHADHWMVDIAPVAPDSPFGPTAGGSMISPADTYRFRNGRLSVESVFAAGHQDYENLRAWGELVITTAPAPTEYRSGGVYAYEMFPGAHTLGCRLQADRISVCALMDDTDRSALDGGRTWEISFFQIEGDESQGGFPGQYDPEVFRICEADGDPDTLCRDHFRMVLEETEVSIFVNGKLYFRQSGLDPLPDEFLNGDVYVYFASIIGASDYDVVRFHWDGLAVNQRLPLGQVSPNTQPIRTSGKSELSAPGGAEKHGKNEAKAPTPLTIPELVEQTKSRFMERDSEDHLR